MTRKHRDRLFKVSSIQDDINISRVADNGLIDLRYPYLDGIAADYRVGNPSFLQSCRHPGQTILNSFHGSFNPMPECIASVLDFHHREILYQTHGRLAV